MDEDIAGALCFYPPKKKGLFWHSKKAIHQSESPYVRSGRDDRIRTCDLIVPNDARYQAVLHPVEHNNYYTAFTEEMQAFFTDEKSIYLSGNSLPDNLESGIDLLQTYGGKTESQIAVGCWAGKKRPAVCQQDTVAPSRCGHCCG